MILAQNFAGLQFGLCLSGRKKILMKNFIAQVYVHKSTNYCSNLNLLQLSANDILVFIVLSSNDGSGESANLRILTRTIITCIHNVRMQMKTRSNSLTSSTAIYMYIGMTLTGGVC